MSLLLSISTPRRKGPESDPLESEEGPTGNQTGFEEGSGEGMPTRWDFRYHQDSAATGQQVALISMIRSGVWTCLTPALQVTTINTRARSAVSATARPGVAYTQMPPLSAENKAVGITASNHLVRVGAPAEASLGPLWKEEGGEVGFYPSG